MHLLNNIFQGEFHKTPRGGVLHHHVTCRLANNMVEKVISTAIYSSFKNEDFSYNTDIILEQKKI